MKMKKNYIYPTIEILPFCALNALCESGEETNGLGGGDNGKNPWTGAMAPPRRMQPF